MKSRMGEGTVWNKMELSPAPSRDSQSKPVMTKQHKHITAKCSLSVLKEAVH